MRAMIDSSGRKDSDRPNLLNLGCGTRVHAEWVNADLAPDSNDVVAVDLTGDLPFARQSFDAVYCSHVLEHLARPDAAALLGRILGLLRPGGILRVLVPDLQAVARSYLELLAQLERDPDSREAEYDWILLEMYDQVTRREPGGDMLRYLADAPARSLDFARSRIGAEALSWRDAAARPNSTPAGAWRRLRRAISAARLRLAGAAAAAIGGSAARHAFAEGNFRQSGEVHRWMYDGYSLARALRRAGFVNVARQTASASRIADFARYRLDVDEKGAVRKPDSLYMEGERALAGAGGHS